MPLCVCFSHGCGSRQTPSGETGFPVDAKTLKRHQMVDREKHRQSEQRAITSSVQQSALASQRAALAAQELEIAASFGDLAISPTMDSHPETTGSGTMYKIDLKRALAFDISSWQEIIANQTANLDSAGLAPDTNVPRNLAESVLSQCEQVGTVLSEILGNFRRARTGKLARDASISAMLDDTEQLWNEVFDTLKATQNSWKLCLLKIEESEKEAIRKGLLVDSGSHFSPSNSLSCADALVQLASLMVVACHLILGLPRRGCHWLFSMCVVLIQATFQSVGAPVALLAFFERLFKQFPRDVRTTVRNFSLETKFRIYAACPKCHETYSPGGTDTIPIYPERCNSSRYSKRCGELIVRPKTIKGRRVFLPIRPYVVFDFQDWLAGFMSRTGYENLMDAAWTKMDASQDASMDDIFQGSVIREFKGPDGRTHFSQSGPDAQTARYLFSMGFDFFNPLRNLTNGKRVSIGIFALVCVNLPISMRYKPENIFLASIVPGPKEPKLDAINPYLRPIIEVFRLFWQCVRYTRTALYEAGRWVLCALIAVICDLPAARKIGGFASFSHEQFCSVCWCNKTVHGYGNYDYHSWERRTSQSCRHWAEQFRDAATKAEAYRCFDKSGLRWSVLLELPYFDPTKHLVIDPMHNLFLGLIRETFQGILGYVPKGVKKRTKKSKPIDIDVTIMPSVANPLPDDSKEKASVRKIMKSLREPMPVDQSDQFDKDALVKTLTRCHQASLVYVGKGLNCIPDTIQRNGTDPATTNSYNGAARPKRWSKSLLATAIVNWRAQQEIDPTSEDIPSTPGHSQPGSIFTDDEMEVLWSDIANMIKPSWATSVPSNISSSSAKLKSDQWRSMGALFLPVSLIRLWSAEQAGGNGDQEDHHTHRRRELLHLIMLLCSAISIITSRTVSPEHARLYLEYMTEFRQELQRLFPAYECPPNFHMAMHLGEFIDKYGPPHGWWTFPFERMIGRLQRILTNYKEGEYEKTIGRTWARSTNFQALFLKSSCPPAIKACKELFGKLVRPQNRNTLIDHYMDLTHRVEEQQEGDNDGDDDGLDIDDFDDAEDEHDVTERFTAPTQSRLSAEVQQAFLRRYPDSLPPTSATIKNRLTIDGVSYTTAEVHEGNSGILSTEGVAYSIMKVLEFPANAQQHHAQHWLVVRRYQDANVILDPYAAYEHIRAKLWGVELHREVEVMPLKEVETHFAKRKIVWENKEVAVIVSLSKAHTL